MGKIKNKWKELKHEAQESFKGISKGAIAMAFWIMTMLLLFVSLVSLLFVTQGAIRVSMTQQALDLREITIEENKDLYSQKESYKNLYETTLKEFEAYKESNPAQAE